MTSNAEHAAMIEAAATLAATIKGDETSSAVFLRYIEMHELLKTYHTKGPEAARKQLDRGMPG